MQRWTGWAVLTVVLLASIIPARAKAPATRPTSKPALKPFRSVDQLLAVLPAMGTEPNDFKFDRLEKELAEKVDGHQFSGTIRFVSAHHTDEGGHKIITFVASAPYPGNPPDLQHGVVDIYVRAESPSDALLQRLINFRRGDYFQFDGMLICPEHIGHMNDFSVTIKSDGTVK